MKIGELPIGLQVLLFILTLGILYFFKQRQAELEKRTNLRNLIPHIIQATDAFRKRQELVLYFSNQDALNLQNTQSPLLKAIPNNYQKCGLEEQEIATISYFVSYHQNLDNIRKDYNERFILHEIQEFKDFLAQLDEYPLSEEQMRAVVCDEDNNLVIAGAGTGKTTTISAKIAYILEKNLARAEELLVISFTNTAVEEMFDRTFNFLKDDEMARLITFKTFNSFGNMVTRYCNPRPKKIAFDGKDYQAKVFLQKSFDKLFIDDSDFGVATFE